ncbi:ferric-chelate reductase [Fusarium sp. NRRL 52700]|nr:ferric-chelate reductase [Fusarium sp. NRRL 52700]
MGFECFPLPLPYLDWHVADAARFTSFLALNLVFSIQSNEFTADYTLYGWLAIANAGLALLMASRNNLFASLLRIPSPILLQYHRWIGLATVAHTTAHVSFNIQHYIETKQVTTSFGNHRIQVGLMAWIALVILFLTALPIVRRRFFEIFYYAHALFFVFVVGALIHASHGPEFMLPGLLLWGVDRAIRLAYNFRTIQVQSIEAFEGNVTKFKVKGLRTRTPGQVVWLQIPKVSFVNWHPFTIASAPNDPQKTATIAIRGLGGFTKAVQYADCSGNVDLHGCDSLGSDSVMAQPLKMRLDGPYGVGSISWGLLPLTVLVAGGIGITPGISIASHIIRQTGVDVYSHSRSHIHLLWVVRDAQHIQWFADELTELVSACAKPDSTTTLEISIFVTGGMHHEVHMTDPSHELQGMSSVQPWNERNSRRSLNTNAAPNPPTKAYHDGYRNGKKNIRKAMGLLPPGLEPETFALPDTRNEVLVRRSNQLSYGSRPNALEAEMLQRFRILQQLRGTLSDCRKTLVSVRQATASQSTETGSCLSLWAMT